MLAVPQMGRVDIEGGCDVASGTILRVADSWRDR